MANNSKAEQKKANRPVLVSAGLVAALFLCMAGWLLYYVIVKAPDVIGNAYNPRDQLLAQRIVRGEIQTEDGVVLAKTQTDSAGNETRVYPEGVLYSNVTGYTARGKTGIESLANFYLLSSHVNAIEQIENELAGKKNPGDNVILSLSGSLQQKAADALKGRQGAVIAMEPKTGRILCMVSNPGFDPNTIAADWDSLNAEGNNKGQLLNRAAQGLYPPGSTFKLLTLLEFVHEHPNDYLTYQYTCNGSYQDAEGNIIRCYGGEKHGVQTIEQAFINSCNGAFADIGRSLNLAKTNALAAELLYNEPLPFQLPYQKSRFGLSDADNMFMREQTAIGQGATMISPLHNLLIAAAVANGGDIPKPQLIDKIQSAGGETVRSFSPGNGGTLMRSEDAALLKRLMRGVVTDGTASALKTDAYDACAKTGSAEYDDGKKTHAWCIAFAPMEDPQIAVCVLVEEGKSGGQTAAPVVRAVLDAWLVQ